MRTGKVRFPAPSPIKLVIRDPKHTKTAPKRTVPRKFFKNKSQVAKNFSEREKARSEKKALRKEQSPARGRSK
jgi:hypothetical protein